MRGVIFLPNLFERDTQAMFLRSTDLRKLSVYAAMQLQHIQRAELLKFSFNLGALEQSDTKAPHLRQNSNLAIFGDGQLYVTTGLVFFKSKEGLKMSNRPIGTAC